MGQLFKPTALVVEDDEDQRSLVSALLEECDLKVVECETAEAAAIAMEHLRDSLVMMFVDVNLAGRMDGVELATFARKKFPQRQRDPDIGRTCAENSGRHRVHAEAVAGARRAPVRGERATLAAILSPGLANAPARC